MRLSRQPLQGRKAFPAMRGAGPSILTNTASTQLPWVMRDDIDEEIFMSIAKDKKYLLLKADTDSGEGEVLYQPWMGKISDLMLADLCSDWVAELAEAEEEGAERFNDWLERHARFLKEGPAKVIPLRRPRGEEE